MNFLSAVVIRAAEPADADAIARVWHAAWQDAHAAVVPASLAPHRTFAFFRDDVHRHIPRALVLVVDGEIVGFSAIEGQELSHFFLDGNVRGRGVARKLLARTEERLAEGGVLSPFLICATGNDRARRFYERMGWVDAGTFTHTVETPDGPVEVEACRMTKRLARPAADADEVAGPVVHELPRRRSTG